MSTNEDAMFVEAMAEMALWRSANPEENKVEHEPEGIRKKRLLVMNRLSSLREGEVDPWMGRTIKVLVRKSTRYIVYIDEKLDVQWWWTQRLPEEEGMSIVQANVTRLTYASAFLLDKNSTLIRPWKSPIFDLLAFWRWCDKGGPEIKARLEAARARAESTALGIRTLVAESMAMVLNDVKRAECEKVQALAEEQILVAKDQLCRGFFFWQFVIAVAFLLFLATVAYWVGRYIPDLMRLASLLQAISAGAFGALLFATTRTRDLHLEPDSERRGLRMEAWSRALIGAGAGLLVHFAFEAELILKAALKANTTDAARMFLCVASGWSEKMLPSLLTRAETLVTGDTSASKSSGK